jgi:ketosteroid isomerase-like protein
MQKVSSLLGISILLSACCLAQSPREALDFLTQLRNASQAQDADAYAAPFDSNGKWDGPFGQNAIGPLNIRTAARQFFTEFGALRFVAASAAQLSPDLVMADLYQMTDGPHVSLNPKLIARGSGTPPRYAEVRTTLILRKQESGWRIIAARVADLRVRNNR